MNSKSFVNATPNSMKLQPLQEIRLNKNPVIGKQKTLTETP